MANTGTFRSAINGFHRQDVMDYLESASQRYETLKKERNELDRIRTEQQARLKELEEAQAEFTAQKEQLAQLQAEAEQLRQQLADAEAVSESLKEQHAQLSDQLAAQREVNEGMRRQLVQITAEKEAAEAAPKEDPAVVQALRSELEALKAQLHEAEEQHAETARRAAEYDSLRDRIATLELNASRRAADIEQSARTEAHTLMERTEQEAREIMEKAEKDAAALLEKAKQEDADLGQRREESFRSFRESLFGAAKDTEASSGLISDELTRLGEKLRGIVSSLTSTAGIFATRETPAAAETENVDAPEGSDEKPAEETGDAPEHRCCDE